MKSKALVVIDLQNDITKIIKISSIALIARLTQQPTREYS